MSQQKLESEIRREQIAEAVLSLVAEHGVNWLTMAKVAHRVGLVPSGIYRHFRNKDEMIQVALDRIDARLQANLLAAVEEKTTSLERLRDVLMRHMRMIHEARAVPRILFSDDVLGGDSARKRRVKQILGAYLGRIAELVQQGQQQGAIRPEIDPPTAALMLFGIVVPAGILWHVTDGCFDVSHHAERAWQLFHRAIAVADRPTREAT